MEQLRFQLYSAPQRPVAVPLLEPAQLLRYFSPGELQSRVKLSLPLLENLRRAVASAQPNLLGLTMFHDSSIDIGSPQHPWRYYVCRLPLAKHSLMGVLEASASLLNYVRMVVLQAKKAMDSYTGYDEAPDAVVRSVLELEVDHARLDELCEQPPLVKGFSSVVHYKLEQSREDELTVFVGFCDKAQQFVHLLLLFRELNMRRLGVPAAASTITEANLDNVVEHLIVVMRRIAGEKDFNLFGQGIRAVLETYIWHGLEATLSRDDLVRRFRDNQRLLLLYECNYAYAHVYNCSFRCPPQELLAKPQCLYDLLYALLTSRGLMLRSQDISYCCSSLQRGGGELSTIVAVEKKNAGGMIFWSTETFVGLVIDRLVAYFDSRAAEPAPEAATFTRSIRSTLHLMRSSRTLVKSRLEVHGDHLVAVPVSLRIRDEHFAKQYDRLAQVLGATSFSPEYVRGLLLRICNAHRARVGRPKPAKQPPTRTSPAVLQLVIAKTIRFLSVSADHLPYLLESTKDKLAAVLPILTAHNPYRSDAMHYRAIRGLANKCLRRNYSSFLKHSSMEQCRSDLLYKYLCAALQGRFALDLGAVALEEEVVGLLTGAKQQAALYDSLLEKLTPLIFALPASEDAEFAATVFKFLEGELQLISDQPVVYSFLGCLFFETVHGPSLGTPASTPRLSNGPYKTKTVSQLTADIKRAKVLELLKAGGLGSQLFHVSAFFRGLRPATRPLAGAAYQVYRDFRASNYGLAVVLHEVARTTATIDMMPLSRCVAGLQEDLETLLEDGKALTEFSVFDEDVESFVLPEPSQEQLNYSLAGSTRTAKDLQLSKSTNCLTQPSRSRDSSGSCSWPTPTRAWPASTSGASSRTAPRSPSRTSTTPRPWCCGCSGSPSRRPASSSRSTRTCAPPPTRPPSSTTTSAATSTSACPASSTASRSCSAASRSPPTSKSTSASSSAPNHDFLPKYPTLPP